MKSLVIIPTYNEIDNIREITRAIHEECPEVHILVADDNSPDGTGAVAKELAEKDPRIHLLARASKQGLGKAYLAGFSWGLEKGYDQLIEMDADFSHRPADLKQILIRAKGYDFVIGSRYVEGGGTRNWTLGRKLISRGGSFYSRTILGYPVNDWTGGFNLWTAQALNKMELQSVLSNGYSFQIELKFRALRAGLKGLEVPILFEDRRVGQSKMSGKIFLEALYRVWLIRFGRKSE